MNNIDRMEAKVKIYKELEKEKEVLCLFRDIFIGEIKEPNKLPLRNQEKITNYPEKVLIKAIDERLETVNKAMEVIENA